MVDNKIRVSSYTDNILNKRLVFLLSLGDYTVLERKEIYFLNTPIMSYAFSLRDY